MTIKFFEVPANAEITAAGTSFKISDMRAEDRSGYVGGGSMFIPNRNYVKPDDNGCPFAACPGDHHWDDVCEECCDGQYAEWVGWNEDRECDEIMAAAAEEERAEAAFGEWDGEE